MNMLSLFSGVGMIDLAASWCGIKTVAFCEIEDYPQQILRKRFPGVKIYDDVRKLTAEQLKTDGIPPIDIICGGFPCFTGDTLITTDTGLKEIKDVEIGDKVLTHTNNFQPVSKTMMNGIKDIVGLKIQSNPEIQTTQNHKFYIRHMHRENDKRIFSKPEWVEVKNLHKDDFIGFPIVQEQKNTKNLTADECYLLGRYIADGYVDNSQRKGRAIGQLNHKTIFCIGKSKSKDFENAIHQYHLCISENPTVIKYILINERMCELCAECGRGAENKEIPMFILNLPMLLLKRFLDGYMDGDGCFTNGEYKATTVSRKLAYSLKMAIHKAFNTPCNIFFCKRKPTCVIEGRVVNQKSTYTVVFQKEIKKQNKAVMIDGVMWYRYVKTEKLGREVVYDLEVQNDHSFVAGGAIAHNCQDVSQAGKRAGFTDKDGNCTRSGLWIEYSRLIGEIRPRWIVAENVGGLLSIPAMGRAVGGFGIILSDLAEMGYDAAWSCYGACDVGAPHKRERVVVVANRRSE